MGFPTATFLENWMFYFMEEIFGEKARFHWAKMIRDNIHNHFMEVKKNLCFYMTSYLVYLLAVNFPYKGLFYAGELGTKKGQLKVYDCYPKI